MKDEARKDTPSTGPTSGAPADPTTVGRERRHNPFVRDAGSPQGGRVED